MYSKDQASQLKQAFWTAFGQYIAPHLSADQEKVNWINYRTGVKHISFKMQADQKGASVAIEISHPDKEIKELIFEQFKEFKNILEFQLGETWTWELSEVNEYGKEISRIYTSLPGASVYKKEDWASLISFLKPRIISLDEFWSTAKYSFELFN